jgi:hypothetical protein
VSNFDKIEGDEFFNQKVLDDFNAWIKLSPGYRYVRLQEYNEAEHGFGAAPLADVDERPGHEPRGKR